MDLEEARQIFPPMWTIYDHPRDYPKKFVVRVWYGLVGEPERTLHDSLNDARESIIARGGSGFFSPSPDEDPCIVETWI